MGVASHILLIFVSMFIMLFMFYAVRYALRIRRWRPASAVVNNVETVSNGDIFYNVITVSYHVDGHQYISTLPRGIQYDDIGIGDTVSVLYNQKNPASCDLYGSKRPFLALPRGAWRL
jgi:hypothetical protein